MTCNYQAIRAENKRRYGTDIDRVGPMLLANRYDDRTHFIFELLQNAEDAFAHRPGLEDSRSVSFQLSEEALRFSHAGKPFDEDDVRGICGIAESTKEDLTAIGRFGIGFKSVYAFTDRPEVHSGTEAFAIESFVWPVATQKIERDPNETVILIPLRGDDVTGHGEIARGLGRLGASALLFLREIEEIRWGVEGGRSGLYLRESQEIAPEVRRVTVIGQEHGQPDVDEEWLVFSRSVTVNDGRHAGHVELAFSLARDEDAQRVRIQRVERSPLVVFFPTVLETHLGFFVQGPYRTTPSRDNVPRSDEWNQRLVGETASLLREALHWLRDRDQLDTAVLRCLPLDPTKFGETDMFALLYDATKSALSADSLLPRFDIGNIPAASARLGRTQELRELFTPTQLSALYGEEDPLVWLSGDITQDRTPELRRYLMQELDVAELTPETVIPRLDRKFLEAQSDDWILKVYEFLSGQSGLRRRLDDLPLVRLEDGTHVAAYVNGQPQAFLPSAIETGFPTVRQAVCSTGDAREFLQSLGLTEPDPVDDVVWNVLPKYRADEFDVSDGDYEADVRRMLTAFKTDSETQRRKLLDALRETAFVMAVDVGDGSDCISTPGEVYLAAGRLKELFAGVEGVLLVDDAYACLRGEDVRGLLEACDATRYLQPVPVECDLSVQDKAQVRRDAGLERATWEYPISDVTLRGLDGLLALIPELPPSEQQKRASLLWQAIGDIEDRRGPRAFLGEYKWSYSRETRTAPFDAAFVRILNEKEWVPGAEGKLQRPEFVLFDTLGWKPNPFLQSKIRFKPPIIDQLAKEAGIEPGVLDLLKKLGVTSEADLRERLGVTADSAPDNGDTSGNVDDALNSLLGNTPPPTAPVPDPAGPDSGPTGRGGTARGNGAPSTDGRAPNTRGGDSGRTNPDGATRRGGNRTAGSAGGRPFVSYVAAKPDDEEPDPDGLDQSARMALETKAIELILSKEPEWRRTPTHNPGFDLYQGDEPGSATRWCEVKAMTGSLKDRPVGLSRNQFVCAQEHGDAYWLYVVEHVGDQRARIVRIQDPALRAKTFTFDEGWLSVAETEDRSAPTQTDGAHQ